MMDTTKFKPKFTLDSNALPSWWDVSAKPLTGGQVALPNARFMNVGYSGNDDGSLTVYIMWHET